MWRTLETGLRRILNGHEGGNPGYKPRTILRATAPASDPTTAINFSRKGRKDPDHPKSARPAPLPQAPTGRRSDTRARPAALTYATLPPQRESRFAHTLSRRAPDHARNRASGPRAGEPLPRALSCTPPPPHPRRRDPLVNRGSER